VQVCVVLSTEIERIAVHINQLDATSLPPLLLQPLLVESDCYGHALVAFTISVHIAHLESTECDLLAFHSSYQLAGIVASLDLLFRFVIIVEAPCESC
jgi:hypothetical protein